MGEHLAHVLGQQAEQLVFDWCQMKFLSVKICAPRCVLDPQCAVFKDSRLDSIFCLHLGQAALCDSKAGQQFLHRKRFRQIIIRSCVQCLDFIAVLTSCTDYDNRHIRPASNLFNHLYAINIRQAKVEQNNVGIMCGCLHNGTRTVLCRNILIIVCF